MLQVSVFQCFETIGETLGYILGKLRICWIRLHTTHHQRSPLSRSNLTNCEKVILPE